MKTLYLDLASGVSGDMFVGALLDLGVRLADLEVALTPLGVQGYHLHARRQSKGSIAGTKFDVHLASEHSAAHGHAEGGGQTHSHHGHDHRHPHDHDHDHEHGHEHGHEHAEDRDFADISLLITQSRLSPWVKEKSLAVFRRIAVAEGKVHGLPPEQVHFHEVGAVDSIVDIVAACVGLELLGKPRILASAVVDGTGTFRCAHGRMPLPAPATLEILAARGVGITQCDEPHELVTPTGAALIAELAEGFGPLRNFVPQQVGYGVGTRDNHSRPNVLRALLGESSSAVTGGVAHDWETDIVTVLETNLDDIHAEILGHFLEQTMAAGALDVFYTPAQMKKNRPAVVLTVLCRPEDADRFAERILRETSAFGVRCTEATRRKLNRYTRKVDTVFGAVDVKVGVLDGQVVQAAPEYEICRQLAESSGVTLKQVYEAATQALRETKPA